MKMKTRYNLLRMSKIFPNRFILVALVFCLNGLVLAEPITHVLTSEQWNIPREASSIIEMPAIRSAMQEFQTTKDAKMLVKYPGGDVGTLWAHELRSWLIALGLSEKLIELIPGSSNPDQLEIIVVKQSY